MELKQKEMFVKDDKHYIIIVTTNYDGKEYAFANRLEEDDEASNEFNIFTKENDEVVYVNDHNLINQLMPIFQELVKNELEKIMKDDNE